MDQGLALPQGMPGAGAGDAAPAAAPGMHKQWAASGPRDGRSAVGCSLVLSPSPLFRVSVSLFKAGPS